MIFVCVDVFSPSRLLGTQFLLGDCLYVLCCRLMVDNMVLIADVSCLVCDQALQCLVGVCCGDRM